MKLTLKFIVVGAACVLSSCTNIPNAFFVDNILHPSPKQLKVKTTAYTENEPDHKKYKKATADGRSLKSGHCAADWSIFPVGTVLKIAGKKYQVSDYGRALIKPKGQLPVVDIYQPSRYAMNRWGVKYFDDVEVVAWGDYHESAHILKDRLAYQHCRTMYNRIVDKLQYGN